MRLELSHGVDDGVWGYERPQRCGIALGELQQEPRVRRERFFRYVHPGPHAKVQEKANGALFRVSPWSLPRVPSHAPHEPFHRRQQRRGEPAAPVAPEQVRDEREPPADLQRLLVQPRAFEHRRE